MGHRNWEDLGPAADESSTDAPDAKNHQMRVWKGTATFCRMLIEDRFSSAVKKDQKDGRCISASWSFRNTKRPKQTRLALLRIMYGYDCNAAFVAKPSRNVQKRVKPHPDVADKILTRTI